MTDLNLPHRITEVLSINLDAVGECPLDVLRLQTPNGVRNLYLRKSSSDPMLTGQIFVDNALKLSVLARASELIEWLTLCRVSGKRPLIVDGGANIGLSCIVLSAQVPDALIVAIEPEASNFSLLVANTEGLPVLPLPAALSAVPGRVVIEDPGDGEWAYRTRKIDKKEVSSETVSAVTVDEIIKSHEHSYHPFIVKIDIEGAESDVFDCDAAWIDQVPLIIVELHDWMLPKARTAQPVLKRLLQSDRDFIMVGENLFSMAIDLPAPAALSLEVPSEH